MLDRVTEKRLIASGGDLLHGGQTRGIDVGRAAHAQHSRLQGHELGELFFGAAKGFGDDDRGVVRRLGDETLDRVLNLDGLIGLEPHFGGSLNRGLGRDRQRSVELEGAGLDLLEQQVKCHDLGQRRGMPRFVGVVLVQDLAGFVIDDDRRVWRSITRPVNCPRPRGTRFCLIPTGAGNRQRCQQTGNR